MGAPFRADHVGSLLRPAELLEARLGLTASTRRDVAQERSGAVSDPERLQAIEDRHILHVLAKQRELGFDVFTDGELRRRNFMSDFTDAVEGFDLGDAVARTWQAKSADAPVSSVTGIVTAKLRQLRRLTAHELPFLRAHSPGAIKITLPSATQFPAIAYKRGMTDKVYPSHSALLQDIVAIVKAEVQALVADGVPYVQIDAPRYSYYIDPRWRDFIRTEMGLEPDAALDEAIRADNACLEAAYGGASSRSDMPARGAAGRRPFTLAMHLCRGNNRSHWYAEGGYDPIAERLFSTLQVDRFLLEYDDERSGTFEPLRFIPRGKTVVLGLVSSKRPQLESKHALIRRIEEAARYVPLENLALSPQCGFASTMEGNLLSENDQWAKLRLVAETAREVWR